MFEILKMQSLNLAVIIFLFINACLFFTQERIFHRIDYILYIIKKKFPSIKNVEITVLIEVYIF